MDRLVQQLDRLVGIVLAGGGQVVVDDSTGEDGEKEQDDEQGADPFSDHDISVLEVGIRSASASRTAPRIADCTESIGSVPSKTTNRSGSFSAIRR